MFYNWQKQFFENGVAAFEQNSLGAGEASRAKNRRPSRQAPTQERGRGRALGGARQIKKVLGEL